MAIQTRRPTGAPSWPILLLAGREGAGKSWAAATASASDLVGRTLWIGVGEDDPDEYGAIPGADFEIVQHDGSYAGILAAVRSAVVEPVGDRPTLVVVDSMTRLWNLISDNAQAIANQRAKGRRNASTGDYAISPDLWNAAAAQWVDVMDALRFHKGPVILTARLDEVMVMEDGRPSTERTWKVQAHKSLPFDASAVVHLRERGSFVLTKVKSARNQLEKPEEVPGFTVDAFWRTLGLADVVAGVRAHSATRVGKVADAVPAPRTKPVAPAFDARAWELRVESAGSTDALRAVWDEAEGAGVLGFLVLGESTALGDLILSRRDQLGGA